MRTVLLIVLLFLSSCSLSAFVNADVMDYFEVGDLAANRIILLNILRAKDSAPLHFSQLSLVRGQISASATATASFPWGPQNHVTSIRRLGAVTTDVFSSPSFDVGSLDTQDFTKCVMAPIAPATVKFFLDEGVDYRLVLLLLVSGARTPGNQELVLNAPESSRLVCYSESVDAPNAMPRSYRIINRDEPCPSGAASCRSVVDGGYFHDDTLFEACAEYALGLARLQSAQLGAPLTRVLVRDTPLPPDSPDATHVIALPPRTPAISAPNPATRRRRPSAMLFADVIGFSRIGDDDLPHFHTDIMVPMAASIAALPTAPRIVETWGDAVFLVYDDFAAAAEGAVTLLTALRPENRHPRAFPLISTCG